MNFSQLSFGAFQLKLFGVFAGIAFFVAAWTYYQGLKKRALDTDFFVHHFWRWVIGGVIVGRLLAFALSPGIFLRHGWFGLLHFWDGSLHPLGTLFGGALIMLFDLKTHQKNVWRWCDLAVLPFFTALLITDIGAFITGAWYGSATGLPWGVTYNTFGVHIVSPVHPVSLYGLLLHFVLLRWVQGRANPWQAQYGKLSFWAVFYWAVVESTLQFFRGDQTLYLFQAIRLEHALYILVALTAFFLAFRRYGRPSSSA